MNCVVPFGNVDIGTAAYSYMPWSELGFSIVVGGESGFYIWTAKLAKIQPVGSRGSLPFTYGLAQIQDVVNDTDSLSGVNGLIQW